MLWGDRCPESGQEQIRNANLGGWRLRWSGQDRAGGADTSICVSNSILKGPEAAWGPGEVTWSTFGPVCGSCASLAVLPFAVVVTLPPTSEFVDASDLEVI